MSRNIRVSEPSAEMQIKIIRAKDADCFAKAQDCQVPLLPTQFNHRL